MRPLGHHVVLRLADDRPLAATPAERRVLTRTLLEVGVDDALWG